MRKKKSNDTIRGWKLFAYKSEKTINRLHTEANDEGCSLKFQAHTYCRNATLLEPSRSNVGLAYIVTKHRR